MRNDDRNESGVGERRSVRFRKLSPDWRLRCNWVRCKPDTQQIRARFRKSVHVRIASDPFPWFWDLRWLLLTLSFLDRVSKRYQTSLGWLGAKYLESVSVSLEAPLSTYLAGIVLPIIIPGTDA